MYPYEMVAKTSKNINKKKPSKKQFSSALPTTRAQCVGKSMVLVEILLFVDKH
jgi:hypothetical protein